MKKWINELEDFKEFLGKFPEVVRKSDLLTSLAAAANLSMVFKKQVIDNRFCLHCKKPVPARKSRFCSDNHNIAFYNEGFQKKAWGWTSSNPDFTHALINLRNAIKRRLQISQTPEFESMDHLENPFGVFAYSTCP